MPSYLNMQDGPEQVAATGLQLKILATEFGTQANSILGEIRAIEATKPWGSDGPGRSFEDSYNQTPEDGGPPFSKSLQEELAGAGKSLNTIGDNIVNAIADYQSTDVDSSEAIIKV
jgi:hypothetical protein